MSQGPVLLLTHAGDHYVPDIVAAALERRGAVAVRVDTDHFPADGGLTVDARSDGLRMTLSAGDVEVDLARARAVWCRRIWSGEPGPVDAAWRHACAVQARDALMGALALLEDEIVVVNRLAAQQRAEHKVLQLRAARAAGLALPPTLVTNEAPSARAFLREHGDVVAKMLVPLSQTMDGSGPFMYTSVVEEEDLADAAALQAAPMIFQAKVHKREELRAFVVGEQVFCGAVTPGALDWRLGTGSPWREAKLPPETEAAAVRLVRDLGLVTGALDFLVDERGAPWFLEVNPAGEWGWLERDLGLPIADAIAGALLSERPMGRPA